jgi:hypothetical protein
MSWLRANKTFVGRLALFALAVQFWLSFGHIHPEDIYGPAEIPLAAASPIGLPTTAVLAPSQREHLDAFGDLCAICASTYLLTTSFLPDAAPLPQATAFQTVRRFDCVDIILIAPRRAPFQSRAPPVA